MTQTYHIQAMTCNGCKDSVTRAFLSIAGVQDVVVVLEKETATVTMDTVIETSIFKQALPSKFKLVGRVAVPEIKEKTTLNTKEIEPEVSKLEQLKPLFLIFISLFLASLALNFNDISFKEAMLDFMGLFFFVFSLFKFFDLSGFALSFAMYDPVAKRVPVYGMVYPFLELILGFMLLSQTQVPIALLVTIIVLGITTIGVSIALLQKKQITCACLGTVLKLPMTQATFIENSVMIFMATFTLLKHYI